jgi:hypothetical protein
MVTQADEPVFDLVDANKPERRALVRMDILAAAYLDKGLNSAIDSLEKEKGAKGALSEDDEGALVYFIKLKQKVKYARSASLPE